MSSEWSKRGGRQVSSEWSSGREQQREGNGRAAAGSTGYIGSRKGAVATGSAQGTSMRSKMRFVARRVDMAEHGLL